MGAVSLQDCLALLVEGLPLPSGAMGEAMRTVMTGQASEAELAAFLTALRIKGVTAEDLTEATRVLREQMVCLNPAEVEAIDTCGTGGDGQNTFNISTAAALVVAACG